MDEKDEDRAPLTLKEEGEKQFADNVKYRKIDVYANIAKKKAEAKLAVARAKDEENKFGAFAASIEEELEAAVTLQEIEQINERVYVGSRYGYGLEKESYPCKTTGSDDVCDSRAIRGRR